jgi:hypothetical protein
LAQSEEVVNIMTKKLYPGSKRALEVQRANLVNELLKKYGQTMSVNEARREADRQLQALLRREGIILGDGDVEVV